LVAPEGKEAGMCKRVLIGLIATLGLVAIGWSDAEAQRDCLKYASGGGTCAIWAPKGVQVEIKFKTDCGPEDTGAGCQASVTAQATDSVVFCQNTVTGVVSGPRRCTPPTGEQFFFGSGSCQDKHENTVGQGHEHHGCTARIVLAPVGAAACTPACAAEQCGTNEVCVDLTPIEMETTVTATAFGSGGGDAPAESCLITGKGTACFFEEHCTTNQNKLRFIPFNPESPPPFPANQKYQCDLTCAGEGCFGD
jgi:hypothetical protein